MNSFLIILLIISLRKWSFFFGYGETKMMYADKGAIYDTPLNSFINFSIMQTDFLKRMKGIDFGWILEYKFSKWTYFVKETYGDPVTSGFSPQALNFLISMEKNLLKGYLGFQYDAGPLPGNMRLVNSDRQDAILFGVGVERKLNSFIIKILINYALTFPDIFIHYYPFFPPYEKETYKYDNGDYVILNLNMENELNLINFGFDFIYKYRTNSIWINKNSGEKYDYGISTNISISPFLKLKIKKFSLKINSSVFVDEYFPSGISIYGKNSFVFLPLKCLNSILTYEY